MAEPLVRVSHSGSVRTLALNRPQALNSFTEAMHGELRAALDGAAADRGVGCGVVTGTGRGFCAGQDLSDPAVAPTREAGAMLMAPPPATKEEYFARYAQTWKILRGGSFPQDEALDRARAERNFERGLNPAGVGRQLRAILASGSRKERLRSVKAPTLVIHGTVDPLVRPAAGTDTAASIPGATLLMIEGMGHALPIPMWPQIIDAIDKHAHAASAKAMH